MTDNKKVYSIEINGIEQSIKQVDALVESLKLLDEKVKAVEAKSVNISATEIETQAAESPNYQSRVSELQQEDALLKQIEQTENKIAEVSRDEYQELLHQKDVLKDLKNEGASRFAEDNLAVKEYSNTMAGLKARLADVKKAMQFKEIGSESFNKLVDEANEINTKLKDIESSYGQFGRNVGNYANGVAEGMRKMSIEVNGTTREFDNARQALKELTNERNTLKLMGEDVGDLDEVVKTLKSDIKDLDRSSSTMDMLLDSFESLIAITSAYEGVSAFFGFDSDEIEESIKKLVALQNVLQGVESIFSQFKSGDGFIGMLSKGDKAIDNFTKKLFGLQTTTKTTNTALAATGTASKTAATGLGTASVAANTATKSFSLASAAATALRVVLSALGIGLVIAAVAALVEGIGYLIDKQKEAKKEQEALNKAVEEGQKAYANAKGELIKTQTAVERFNGTKKQEKALVEQLNSKYGKSLGTYKTLAEWKRILKERGEVMCQVMFKEAQAQALLNEYTEAYIRLQQAKKEQAEGGDKWAEWLPWNWGGKSAQDKANERVQQLETELSNFENKIKDIYTEIGELNKDNSLFEYAPQIEKNGKANEKAAKKAESNLIKLRLELMKDGLAKTLLQLRAEREQRIKEAKETQELVAEQVNLINELYDKKELEARKSHYEKLLKLREDYNDEMKRLIEQNYKDMVSNSTLMNANKYEENQLYESIKRVGDANFSNDLTIDYNKTDIHVALKEYWTEVSKIKVLTKDNISQIQESFTTASKSVRVFGDELQKLKKKYDGLKFKDDPATNMMEAIFPTENGKELGNYAKEEIQRAVDYYNSEMAIINDIITKWGHKIYTLELDQTRNLGVAYQTRYAARKLFYSNMFKASKEFYDKDLALQNDALEEELKSEKEAEEKRYTKKVGKKTSGNTTIDTVVKSYKSSYDNGELENMNKTKIEAYFSEYKKLFDNWLKEQDDKLKKGEISIEQYLENTSGKLLESYRNGDITFVEYLDNMVKEDEYHQNRMSTIETTETAKRKENELNYQKNMKRATSEYYESMESEISQFVSAVSRMVDKAESRNAWGFINYQKTKEALKELKKKIKEAMDGIVAMKNQLIEELKAGEIDFGDFDKAMTKLNALENELNIMAENVNGKLKDLGGAFWSDVNMYIQAVGQTLNTILSSLSDMTDNYYEAEISKQDKYIKEYEDLLNKQKDKTQEYASAVDSIEDELSNARGDRRQHLIDQLNAEMAAQRASLAQEKKIEKEREKAEEKKKKLEHDQAVAKKKMDLAQAAINTAMAISMAAVNKWPVPAIPMMALAAAAGAAQYAAIASQNIPSYGSGGVLLGKSHKEGGIKVLGGRAEVEGGEFITNKLTTTKNVEVLEYINSKKRKLNLEDFVDFYGGKKSTVKKNVQSAVKTKFADGGVIPTLRNDIELSDRLLQTFEDYSNRPVQVAVVDIIDGTQRVNDVRVMAGIES